MASAMSAPRARSRAGNAMSSPVNMLLISIFHACVPLVKAVPMPFTTAEEHLPMSPDDASLWIYLGVALALVLGGGVFAGLTIA